MKAIVTRAKYEIRFAHYNVDGRKFRNIRADEELRKECDLFGKPSSRSRTTCVIRSTKNIGIGVARVHPKDSFDIVVGRKVALARALTNAGLSKRARTLVWKQYLASK